MVAEDAVETPRNASPAERPGLILSAMAAICGIMLLVPIVGAVIVLYANDVLSFVNVLKMGGLLITTLLTLFAPQRQVMALLAIPTGILLCLCVTYLIAFLRRSPWGPPILSAMAIFWAMSVSASTILVPLLAYPGGLPVVTTLGMLPGIIAPVLFALGFVGFLLYSDVARMWFRRAKREPRI